LRDVKGENPSFSWNFLFHNMNIDLSMSRMQQEKIESKGPRAGWAVKKCGQPATLCPQKFWDLS
jgi:hypothetical protein